jgi:hypothetical protein
MVALPVLVSGLEAEMIRLGYKGSTMVWYRGSWRRLQRYFCRRRPVTTRRRGRSMPATSLRLPSAMNA